MFKKFLVIFLMAATMSAQLVDSSRLKKKTNGGITGDTSNAVAVAPYRGTSSPASPVTGQMWCDTNTTPCTMKTYDGSAWVATTDNAIDIRNDFSSFPGSPTDGQVFVTRNPPELCYYDSTNTKWWCFATPASQSGANVADNFTGTTITDPASTLTIADNATAGNATAGTKSCKVTFANSTGGETNMSTASGTVTFTGSHSFNFTSIPTGGTGTTQRRIYCTKAGAAATGPWYWIYTVNDNSTTSVTAAAGLADASLVRHGPKSNYSAALSGIWTVENHTTATTSGGCGSTGSALACSQGSSAATGISGLTTDATIRAYTDLSAFNSGDYTVQYRLKFVSITADTGDGNVTNPCFGTLRAGTADNSSAFTICGGHQPTATNWTSPLSLTNYILVGQYWRSTVGGSHSGTVASNAPWPRVGATALWVRFVKKGNFMNGFTSLNARDWTPIYTTSNATPATEGNLAFGSIATVNPTRFELEIQQATTGAYYYVEIDTFTITVN